MTERAVVAFEAPNTATVPVSAANPLPEPAGGPAARADGVIVDQVEWPPVEEV